MATSPLSVCCVSVETSVESIMNFGEHRCGSCLAGLLVLQVPQENNLFPGMNESEGECCDKKCSQYQQQNLSSCCVVKSYLLILFILLSFFSKGLFEGMHLVCEFIVF